MVESVKYYRRNPKLDPEFEGGPEILAVSLAVDVLCDYMASPAVVGRSVPLVLSYHDLGRIWR